MKQRLIFFTLLMNLYAIGQSTRNDLARSRIYMKGTYIDNVNENISVQTRMDLGDTIVGKTMFHKFIELDFVDYAGIKKSSLFYESFTNEIYCLLDSNQNVVHKINYHTNKEQIGIIFGKETTIELEFMDGSNNFPKDTLILTDKTPRKYYQKVNSEIYLVIIPDLKTVAVSSDGNYYVKQFFGDNYNAVTTGFQNNYSASTKFDIQTGDEIQLVYRRKWYNDTTNLAEYQDKQFNNIKYIGDTMVGLEKSLIFETESYNYLSGQFEKREKMLVNISDSGYKYGSQFIPFKEYKTVLKLVDGIEGKDIYFQGVTYDTINGNSYPKIVKILNDPYRFYILPFFPLSYYEFGNVQGIVTYTKIKGKEGGIKREREFITTRNNLREINCIGNKEIEVTLYFIEEMEVEITIQDFETGKIVGSKRSSAKKGLNNFVIRSSKYVKNKEYSVLINYKGKNTSGSLSDSVKTN